MEKKNYILLFLQIAAIAVSGVFGGLALHLISWYP